MHVSITMERLIVATNGKKQNTFRVSAVQVALFENKPANLPEFGPDLQYLKTLNIASWVGVVRAAAPPPGIIMITINAVVLGHTTRDDENSKNIESNRIEREYGSNRTESKLCGPW